MTERIHDASRRRGNDFFDEVARDAYLTRSGASLGSKESHLIRMLEGRDPQRTFGGMHPGQVRWQIEDSLDRAHPHLSAERRGELADQLVRALGQAVYRDFARQVRDECKLRLSRLGRELQVIARSQDKTRALLEEILRSGGRHRKDTLQALALDGEEADILEQWLIHDRGSQFTSASHQDTFRSAGRALLDRTRGQLALQAGQSLELARSLSLDHLLENDDIFRRMPGVGRAIFARIPPDTFLRKAVGENFCIDQNQREFGRQGLLAWQAVWYLGSRLATGQGAVQVATTAFTYAKTAGDAQEISAGYRSDTARANAALLSGSASSQDYRAALSRRDQDATRGALSVLGTLAQPFMPGSSRHLVDGYNLLDKSTALAGDRRARLEPKAPAPAPVTEWIHRIATES